MRNNAVLPMILGLLLIPQGLPAGEELTANNLPTFLKAYQTNFNPLDAVYVDLENENLVLRGEGGQLLERRHVEDRRRELAQLRKTTSDVAANPRDVVLALRLAIQTESLADDLFDLSQIAYENDREELGKRLSDLQITMEHNRDLLQTFALNLAGEQQERLRQLEQENEELQRRLKSTEETQK